MAHNVQEFFRASSQSEPPHGYLGYPDNEPDLLDQNLATQYPAWYVLKIWEESFRAREGNTSDTKAALFDLLDRVPFRRLQMPLDSHPFQIYTPDTTTMDVLPYVPGVAAGVDQILQLDKPKRPIHLLILPEKSFMTTAGSCDASGTMIIMNGSLKESEALLAHEYTHARLNQEYGQCQSLGVSEGTAMAISHLMFPEAERTNFRKRHGFDDVIRVAIQDDLIGHSHTMMLTQAKLDRHLPTAKRWAYGYGGIMMMCFINSYCRTEDEHGSVSYNMEPFHRFYSQLCNPELSNQSERVMIASALQQMDLNPQSFSERLDQMIEDELTSAERLLAMAQSFAR